MMSSGLLFSWPIATAKRIAVLVSFAGATVLLGWAFDFPRLKSILPGLPKMSPLTALLCVVSGLALWITARWPSDWCNSKSNKTWTSLHQRLFIGCAATVAGVAGLRLAFYFLGRDPGFDQLGFHEAFPGGSPAYLAPATATAFLLLGIAFPLGRTMRFKRTFQTFALMGGLVAWLGF